MALIWLAETEKKKPEQRYSCLPDLPAYPIDLGASADDPYNGVTKREYFAAMALQGLLASPKDGTPAQFAEDALRAADALVDVLNVKGRV